MKPNSLALNKLLLVMVACVSLWYFVDLMTISWGFTTDDAYITLRYAEHWAAGHNISWNIGDSDPVEGYSNFSYVVLFSVAILSSVDPVVFIKLTALLSVMGSVVCLYLISRLLFDSAFRFLPIVLFLSFQGNIFWFFSGLETPFYQCLVLMSVTFFLRGLGYPVFTFGKGSIQSLGVNYISFGICGLLVFILGLTRIEGPLIGIIFALLLLYDVATQKSTSGVGPLAKRDFLISATVLALTFSVPYAIYVVWKVGYFGELLPNSVTCKSNYDGDNLKLIGDFYRSVWPIIVLSLFALRSKYYHLTFIVFSYLIFYTVLLYGKDPLLGYNSRHFLACYGLLTLTAAIGAKNLASALSGSRILRGMQNPMRAFAIVIALAPLSLFFLEKNFRDSFVFRDRLLVHIDRYQMRTEARVAVSQWLGDRLSPGDVYAIGDAGLIPYSNLELDVIDLFCLNSKVATTEPYFNSYELFVKYVIEQEPKAIVLNSYKFESFDSIGPIGTLITEQADFSKKYTLTKKFGKQTQGKGYNYWVYEHKNI